MYRIFDMDEDGMVSKNDLIDGLTMLYEETTIERDLLERMAEKIMLECEAFESENINFEGIH
jgi:Ca2+-binding EF-hand superfamily protein